MQRQSMQVGILYRRKRSEVVGECWNSSNQITQEFYSNVIFFEISSTCFR